MMWRLVILVSGILTLASCRGDVMVFPAEEEEKGTVQSGPIVGFYLLNEGNMGSNKCTLDY